MGVGQVPGQTVQASPERLNQGARRRLAWYGARNDGRHDAVTMKRGYLMPLAPIPLPFPSSYPLCAGEFLSHSAPQKWAQMSWGAHEQQRTRLHCSVLTRSSLSGVWSLQSVSWVSHVLFASLLFFASTNRPTGQSDSTSRFRHS